MIPTEKQEWEKLANILKAKQYKFTHIANEIWISGKVWMLVNKNKKLQWLSKWFPDYCIILKRWSLLFIELKRQRKILKSGKLWASPSIISKEQIEWLEALNKIPNVEAHICYGCDEAIVLIEKLEK